MQYAKMLERAGAQIIACHGRIREQRGQNSVCYILPITFHWAKTHSYVPTFCRALQTGPRSAPSNEPSQFPSSRTVTSSISPTSLAAFKKQVQMASCLPKASCTTQHYFRESSGRCCFPLIRRHRIVQAQNTSLLQMQISLPDNHGMQTSLWSIFASSPS